MILRRDPGHYGTRHLVVFVFSDDWPVDAHFGPILISMALFVAILANFIMRGESAFHDHVRYIDVYHPSSVT